MPAPHLSPFLALLGGLGASGDLPGTLWDEPELPCTAFHRPCLQNRQWSYPWSPNV